ncbi:hypothetical protein TPB0596_25570 [Tsukamurella pulmonis]|nr:hypothetical protein [Tsukamurella pulmonis]BDD82794.1 hypothetical protein TPB0596_25570 [Tsukamurella pulmonis]
MGVFDRADEGSEEARAYRAELAAENNRLAARDDSAQAARPA